MSNEIEVLLLDAILKDSPDISDEQCDDFIVQIRDAIKENRIVFIKKMNIPIGFLVHSTKNFKTFINNLFIFKKFRNKSNLLSMRKYLRDKINSSEYKWENNKRKRFYTTT